MAYDRYDPRDDRPSWRDDEHRGRFEGRDRHHREHDSGRGRRDERGFFERAGDEISSWFGSDGDRSRHDERGHGRGYGRDDHRSDYHDERGRGGWFEDAKGWFGGSDREHHRDHHRDREHGRHHQDEDRGHALPTDWSTSQRDYRTNHREMWGGGDRGPDRDDHRERGGYRPMTGDYGREGRYAGGGMSRERGSDFARNRGAWDYDPGEGRGEARSGERYGRSESRYDRDDYRRTSFAGSAERDRDHDSRERFRSDHDERERGAMFGRERDDERSRREHDDRERRNRDRSRGPHMLDRSFSGTYR